MHVCWVAALSCPGRSAAPQGRSRPSSRAMVVRCRPGTVPVCGGPGSAVHRFATARAAPSPGHAAERRAHQTLAVMFALACALAPLAGHAQSPKLEAAYVVLGPQGAVARAVIADATRCPPIAVDGGEQAMNVRARPDAAFPALVCELPLAAGTKSASIENLPLPVLKPTLTSIAAFGDTGCRLKAGKRSAKADA